MDAKKYLAIGPGYWAVHEEPEHALLHLLAIMPSLSDVIKRHRSVFNQVEGVWEKCAIEHERETDHD